MKVGLIGPFPPPRGGVSVHLSRLAETLIDQGVMVKVFKSNRGENGGGRVRRKLSHLLWLLQLSAGARLDILHIHVSEWRERALIIFLARRRKIKTVVTFHSLRDELSEMTVWQKRYVSYVVNHADHLIAVGANEERKLTKQIKGVAPVSVLHTFIPPRRIDTEIPDKIVEFMQTHELIISANASNMDFYQGQDTYGLDMLVELCGRIRAHIKVGFVYCLTQVTDQEYYNKIQAKIKELNLEDEFLIVLDNLELWPVLEKSHIFIRPTCTDSYGVSIAEALTLGIPSLASDVCQRPEGTILFRNRNREDLYAKVCEIIQNYDQCKARVQELEFENCVPAIRDIYHKLLS